MIRITNLKLSLDDALDYPSELASLRKLVISKYNVKANHILLIRIFKKAIDARKKQDIHFVYTVDCDVSSELEFLNKNNSNITKSPDLTYKQVEKGEEDIFFQPVIVGFGPSGIFSALLLARRGYSPIVLEQGQDVDDRTKAWFNFINTREFSEDKSILYGEGGAGTFSDGKLTTLINDLRCRFVLKELVNAGAHPEIMHVSKPHIGTDVLKEVVKNIRKEIIKQGGTIRFNSKVTDFVIEDNKLKAVIVNGKEKIPTELCLLGIGHSSRATYEKLLEHDVKIQPKPFSVGVRIEHPQELINEAQYGKTHSHLALGAADYKLSYHAEGGRSSYTFCMCPGGYVVNAASEDGTVVTNGMSFSKRDGANANAAVLVNVTPKDFEGDHPLAGVDFQRKLERKAFELAGKNFNAPIQLLQDFLEDKPSTEIKSVIPTIKPGYSFVEIKEILPNFVTKTIREAILFFDRKLRGFAYPDAIITAPETRSSSPIRILRNEAHESNVQGLYPMGEGSGYAGGIMSSAVDGLKTAEKIIEKFVF